MSQFSNKFKNPVFGPFSPFLGHKKIFLESPALSHTTSYGFQHHTKIQKKLMIQLKENARTDGSTNGRTDRPCFIGPFQLLPGVQKDVFYFKLFNCPPDAKRSKNVRGHKITAATPQLQNPRKPVQISTVSRYCRQIMTKASRDSTTFSSYSSKPASTAKVKVKGLF